MDVNTHPPSKADGRRRSRKQDGYTVHLLSRDGTIATVGKKRSDGTRELTVEVCDRRSERKIPANLARNLRSPEFAQAVGEMKAKLLRRGKPRRLS